MPLHGSEDAEDYLSAAFGNSEADGDAQGDTRSGGLAKDFRVSGRLWCMGEDGRSVHWKDGRQHRVRG